MERGAETIEGAVRRIAAQFDAARLNFGHGTDNALDDAAHLVLSALRLPPEVPDAVLGTVLTDAERATIDALVARRLRERLPTAYLTGVSWFCGLRFEVDERVLVPRSPIAEFIESGFEPWLRPDTPPGRILDIGTGSGCIAIACAVQFPDAEVDALDVSPGALEVARRNIAWHGVGDRVRAIRSDVYDALDGRRYDVIVSNPPYVEDAQMGRLPPEYRHEPALGLVAGAAGLDVAVRILRGARAHLRPGGILVVEVGDAREALDRLYPRLPFIWLEFARGGEGVFLLTVDDLPPDL